MPPLRDMYDALPADRGEELRRLNEQRLAELEAQSQARQARLAELAARPGAVLPPSSCSCHDH